MNVFLEIKNIKKHFGEGESRVEVLKGIDIEIEKGEFCVLLGPSGSGKSTLLNIIGGIDAADVDQIEPPREHHCKNAEYLNKRRKNSRHERKGIDPLQKKALGLYLPDVQPYT